MLFNSFSFGFFLVGVVLLYWLVFNRQKHLRNAFLLVASYFFYGCWDWRFLFLIMFVTATDFFMGMLIDKSDSKRKRKALLTIALIVNLGLLGVFKYLNFFIDSASALLQLFGANASLNALNIILPVGISFFTFQGLSYVIDIYRGNYSSTKDYLAFSTFISFFPQLVAGPIERAKDLLPQFLTNERRKPFDYEMLQRGLFLVGVGLFKKIVIADRLAIYVDNLYSNPTAGLPTIVAALFFTFQLYLDFSAYSQIAIGTAKILGYRLSTNFRRPYLATNFRGFWSRWHITLTSWFRDYLYISLGGNRKGAAMTIINTMIVFGLSGLWHGASWNFVIWGCLNGLSLIVFDRWLKLNPKKHITKILGALFVTGYWCITLIFFRAETFSDAIATFSNIGFSGADLLYNFGLNKVEFSLTCWLVVGLMIIELILEKGGEKLENMFFNRFGIVRWLVYIVIVLATIYLGIYGIGSDNNFIYFQF